MKKLIKSLLLAAAMLAAASYSVSAEQAGRTLTINNKTVTTTAAADFRNAMRKLWEEHTTWTRLFIVDAAANLPEKDATTARLLQNQADIGNAVRPYYGNAAGDQLTKLLKEHIMLAAEVVSAAKANNSAAKANNKKTLDEANRRWFANADEISAFLSKANSANWPEATLRHHMHDHLKLTTDEAVAQLKGDWKGSIAAYDKVHTQILGMAAVLSDGIIKQFPGKFQ